MSPTSHAVSRLRKLYVLVLRKMRALNMRATHRQDAAWHAQSLEMMEPRVLLSGSSPNASDFKFTYVVYSDGQLSSISADQLHETGANYAPFSSSSPVGLNATQIRTAYGIIPGLLGDGTGQTIAIVDAYDDPALVNSDAAGYITSDLHYFNVAMGLPDFGGSGPSFRKVGQDGSSTLAPASGSSGWSVEEALDVEWAHAIAPGANIILVEANSPSDADLVYDVTHTVTSAVDTARHLPGVSVVSMSFGRSEDSGELSLDPVFSTPAGHGGVTFVASTGDSGAPGGYPAMSPYIVAIGGTTLSLSGNNYSSESGWSGSGGSVSGYETEPNYQKTVVPGTITSTRRATPDVSFDADPASGVAVYDSYDYGSSAPWAQIGGTSLSAPCWAGLIAIANQIRVSAGGSPLDGYTQTLPALYQLPASDFHDVITGSNGYSAGAGYDLVTGRGSPIANLLVPALAMGLNMSVVGSTPASGSTVTAKPTDFIIHFSDSYVSSSVSASDLTVNGIAADTFALTDSTTVTFHYSSSPVTAQGTQTMSIAAGTILRASDNGPIAAWNTTFRYDAMMLAVASTVPANGTLVALPVTSIDINFNEAVDPASIGASDLSLSQGSVVSAAMVDADTVRYTLSGITSEGTLSISMAAGAVADAFGNVGAAYSGSFTLDNGTTTFPTPLTAVNPAGGMIYSGSVSTSIGSGTDTDSFTINLEAGQTLTALVHPTTAALQPTVVVLGPDGAMIASATAVSAGQDALTQSIAVATAGTYTITVGSAGGTSGNCTVQVTLNAAVEGESHNGASNNTAAAAQDINGSFISLGAAAWRGAVLGTTESTSGDYYSFVLNGGDRLTAALTALTTGTIHISLTDAAGTVLATGVSGPSNVLEAISGFAIPANGRYCILVTGGSSISYSVVMTRNAAFEIESDNTITQAMPLLAPGASGQQGVLGYLEPSVTGIEPDNYSAGTVLTNIVPGITLRVSNNIGTVSAGTVAVATSSYVSTGTRVFGTTSTSSWSDTSCLRIDFAAGVSSVSIDLVADDSDDPGFLKAYNSAGVLLQDLETGAPSYPGYLTMTITRPTADIAYVVAGGQSGQVVYLDRMVVNGGSSGSDYYSFTANAGDKLTLQTATPGDGAGQFVNTLDPRLELYSATGTLLASDDNGAPDGRNASLTYLAPSAGTYIVRVASGNGSTGEYVLSLGTPLTVNLPGDEPENAGTINATVSIPAPLADDLIVSLVSGNPGRLTAPATATIPAGQTSVIVPITVVDDLLLNGPEAVSIMASAAAYSSATGTMTIHDNETASLVVMLPRTAQEGAGTLASAGTITASAAPSRDIVIQLTSSDMTQVGLPPTVVLHAGQTTASFDVTIGDDYFRDSDKTVSVTAHTENWTDGSATITVVDADFMQLHGSWPTFGNGPSHTEYFHGLLGDSPQFAQLWSASLASDQVAVADGRVYATTNTGIVALNETTGAQIWRDPISGANSVNPATFDSGHVYVQTITGNEIGQLWSLDAATGATTWVSPFGCQWESYFAPTVADGKVWINAGTYGGMYGYDQATGAQLFFVSLAQYDQWTPTYYNGKVYSWVAGTFSEHNPTTGVVNWSLNLGGTSPYSMYKISAIADNRAFMVSPTGLFAVDLASHAQLWGLADTGFTGSPAVVGNTVYALHGTQLRAYDVATGALKGTFDAGQTLVNQPIVTDDGIIVASSSKTFLVRRSDYQLLNTIPVGGQVTLADNMLFIANASTVYAYRLFARPLTLTVPASLNEDGGTATGSISVTAPPTSDLVVSLTSASTHTGRISIPSSATIRAGQTSVSFPITINNDALLNGPEDITITAATGGYSNGTGTIRVHDDETASLTLSLPATAEEKAGSVSGTITASAAPAQDIAIHLTSGDTARLTAPAVVILPAGQTSVNFSATLLDDGVIEAGPTPVTVTASMDNWTGDAFTIAIQDSDAYLTVVLPAGGWEGQTLSGAGTVTLGGTLTTDLTVSLVSLDSAAVWVPATVVIPAGAKSVAFSVTFPTDGVRDGNHSVTITASGAALASASATLVAHDRDVDHFSFDAITGPKTAAVPFAVNARAFNLDNELITVYSDTASLSASGAGGTLPVTPTTVAFNAGVWTGNVSISAVDTAASLSLSGGGVTTASNSFALQAGPVASLQWSTIPAVEGANIPFPVTITARDANGFVATGFNGSAALTGAGIGATASLVISEVYVGTPDAIEFTNVSGTSLDLSGWKVLVYDSVNGSTPLQALTIPAGTICPAGAAFVLEESGTTPGTYPHFYSGVNFDWTTSTITGVLLQDNAGRVVDFMAACLLTPSTITNPVTIVPNYWQGSQVAAVSVDTNTYQRIGNADRDNATDWVNNVAANLGTINPGLTVPFAGGNVPVVPGTLTFVNGVWTGNVTVSQTATGMHLHADDGAGHSADSNAFNVTSTTQTPATPVLAAASDTGVSSSDKITSLNNSSPAKALQFTVGSTTVGATVELYWAGHMIGSAIAAGATTTITTNGTTTLPEGAISVVARQTIGAVPSGDSAALSITVDTVAPTVTVATLSTTDSTPPLSGAAGEALGTVQVTVGGKTYNGTVSGSAWNLADNTITPALGCGTYDVAVTVTDVAGNVAHDTTTNELTVTPPAPSTPDLQAGSDTGSSSTDNITKRNNASPAAALTFSVGNTVVGALVELMTTGNVVIGSAVASGATTTIVTNGTTLLADGARSIYARQTSNSMVSPVSSSLTVTVDTVAPGVTVTSKTTSDSRPPLAGTIADAGTVATILVTVNGRSYSATISGTTWSIADNTITSLPAGTYDVALVATDAAGNVGADTTTNELQITPGTGQIKGLVWNDLNGNGVKDGTESVMAGVTVYLDNNNSATLDAGDVQTITLADGSYQFTALGADTFYIRQVAPAGMRQILPATAAYTVSLGEGQVLTGKDFGNAVAPRVIGSSIQEGAKLAPGSLTYIVTFDEAIKTSNITTSTITLHGNFANVNYTAGSVSFNGSGTVLTVNYTALPEDSYTLTLPSTSAAFTNAGGGLLDGEALSWPIPPNKSGDGVEGGNFVLHFVADTDSIPLPTPLTAVAPAGGLIYTGSASCTIGTGGDIDSFIVNLDAGQTLTALVHPTTAALQPIVQVFSPGGVLLGSASAAAAGQDALLQTVAVSASGTYTIAISPAGGTAGNCSLQVTLNAAVEAEGHGGADNGSAATAQDINGGFVSLGNGMSTAAVVGTSEGGANITVFTDGFESGALGPAWSKYSTTSGRIQISGASGTGSGSYAMLMDNGANDATYQLNEAIVTVNLSGKAQATLTFSQASFSDENDAFSGDFTGHYNADGVAISDDGVHWHPVWSGTGSTTWVTYSIDLAAAAASAGMTLNANFRIKFQQYDNYALSTDGRGWDDIKISAPAATPGDYYSVNLNSGDRITAAITGLVHISLTDAAGTVLATGVSGPSNVSEAISGFAVPANGKYCILVTGGSNTSYSVVMTRNAAFEIESDNTITQAMPLPAPGASGQQGVLGYLEPGVTGIEPDNYSAGTALTNIVPGITLRVSDNIGTVLTGTVAAATSSYTSTGTRVFGTTGTSSWSSTSCLRVDFAAGVSSVSIDLVPDDSSDPGFLKAYNSSGVLLQDLETVAPPYPGYLTMTITRPTADIAYVVAGAQSGEVVYLDRLVVNGGSSGNDYYSFTANAGDKLTLQTATPGDGAGQFVNTLDPKLELYSATGTLLASDDNGAPDGRNASLAYLAPSAGTYIVRVASGNGSTGEYVLIARAQPLAAPVVNSEPSTTPGTSNTIQWSAVPNADHYYVEYDDDPAFGSPNGNSGWITDTSYTFTALPKNIPLYYHVKAGWVSTSSSGSWSQTTQADFQADTLTNVSATSVPGDVVLGGSTSPTTDTVGSTTNAASGTSLLKGNFYQVTKASLLTKIEMYLNISTSAQLRWAVYDSTSSSGSYSLIYQSADLASGTGTGWYASPSLSISLQAGHYYAMVVSWSGSLTYYWSSTHPTSVSFGSSIAGCASYAYPPPSSVSNTSDSACYYERVTTGVASGYLPAGTATSTVISWPSLTQSGTLTFNKDTPAGTAISVDVLDTAGSLLAANVASGTSLISLGISATSIRLRANLSTTNSGVTPSLHDWTVAWDPAVSYVESPWSNTVSSTQMASSVAGRYIFYNNSRFDGNDLSANAADDAAIAPSLSFTDPEEADKELGKQALLPGQTASFVNYTSYSRGINGIMVDIADLADRAHLTLANIADYFAFKVGNDNNVQAWNDAPAPSSVLVRPGAGVGGSDRVTITWADNAITNAWLQVTLLSNRFTGLASADVFYWGNAPAESGNQAGYAIVNSFDEVGARNHPHMPASRAGITDAYDYNRDGLVNSFDQVLARTAATTPDTALQLIAPPIGLLVSSEQPGSSPAVLSLTGGNVSLPMYGPVYVPQSSQATANVLQAASPAWVFPPVRYGSTAAMLPKTSSVAGWPFMSSVRKHELPFGLP